MNSNNFIWLVFFSLSLSLHSFVCHMIFPLWHLLQTFQMSVFPFFNCRLTFNLNSWRSFLQRHHRQWGEIPLHHLSEVLWIESFFIHPNMFTNIYSKKKIVVSEIRLLDHMVFNRKTWIPNIKKTKAITRHSYANCLRKNHTGLVRRRSHTVVEISIWLANFV